MKTVEKVEGVNGFQDLIFIIILIIQFPRTSKHLVPTSIPGTCQLFNTHSDSTSATVHLYCAVENKQMSANCRTDTLIFFTVLLELFAMCTFTDKLSP